MPFTRGSESLSDLPSVTQLRIKPMPPATTTHTLQTPCSQQEDGTQKVRGIIPFQGSTGNIPHILLWKVTEVRNQEAPFLVAQNGKPTSKLPSAIKGTSWCPRVGSPVVDFLSWAENGRQQRLPRGCPHSFQPSTTPSGSPP